MRVLVEPSGEPGGRNIYRNSTARHSRVSDQITLDCLPCSYEREVSSEAE